MTWAREIKQLSATQSGVVYALCTDGSVWMLPDTLPVARAVLGVWRRLPDIPRPEGGAARVVVPKGCTVLFEKGGGGSGSTGPAEPVPPIDPVIIGARMADGSAPRAPGGDKVTRLQQRWRDWWSKQ